VSVEAMAIALHHSRAKSTARLVLVGIANHDGDGGAWPSIATLMKYTGSDRRTVQRAIDKLEALGEVRRGIQQGGKTGAQSDEFSDWHRPNLYHFLLKCPPDCDRSRNHKTTRTFVPDPLPVDPEDWRPAVDALTQPDELPEGSAAPTSQGPTRGRRAKTPPGQQPVDNSPQNAKTPPGGRSERRPNLPTTNSSKTQRSSSSTERARMGAGAPESEPLRGRSSSDGYDLPASLDRARAAHLARTTDVLCAGYAPSRRIVCSFDTPSGRCSGCGERPAEDLPTFDPRTGEVAS
jgi:hypothetical protein